jgi:hypothetical protein
MPTTYAIPNGRTVMDATTYTGTGSNVAIVNTDLGTTGFQPDLVWIKCRSNAYDNDLFDSIRGPLKILVSNSTNTQDTQAAGKTLTAFNTNGFQLGTDNSSSGSVNNTGFTYVGWQWNAGAGTTSTNNVGSISSTTSVNATAGFSIVSYTGNGVASTVGHGLSAAPAFVIVRNYSITQNWIIGQSSMWDSNQNSFLLFTTSAVVTNNSAIWNGTRPTSSVINIGSDSGTNGSGNSHIAYCWTPIAGFSQFGSYTGNGSSDGPFVYTGFRPAFLMIKCTQTADYSHWVIKDSTRNPSNTATRNLYPNFNYAEDTEATEYIDLLSNGFKIRGTVDGINGSSKVYIYMAFAENPFKFANAR